LEDDLLLQLTYQSQQVQHHPSMRTANTDKRGEEGIHQLDGATTGSTNRQINSDKDLANACNATGELPKLSYFGDSKDGTSRSIREENEEESFDTANVPNFAG